MCVCVCALGNGHGACVLPMCQPRCVVASHFQVDVLPAPHGSSIFSRGDTQALCTVTLGPPHLTAASQSVDMLPKSFFLHYEFPPYCVNEVGRLGVNRRMVGHGALAEKVCCVSALQIVSPSLRGLGLLLRWWCNHHHLCRPLCAFSGRTFFRECGAHQGLYEHCRRLSPRSCHQRRTLLTLFEPLAASLDLTARHPWLRCVAPRWRCSTLASTSHTLPVSLWDLSLRWTTRGNLSRMERYGECGMHYLGMRRLASGWHWDLW